jgi:hypothetical protein
MDLHHHTRDLARLQQKETRRITSTASWTESPWSQRSARNDLPGSLPLLALFFPSARAAPTAAGGHEENLHHQRRALDPGHQCSLWFSLFCHRRWRWTCLRQTPPPNFIDRVAPGKRVSGAKHGRSIRMRKKRIGVGDTVTATLYLMVLTHAIRHSQPAVNMHSRSSLVLLLFQLTAASNRKVQPSSREKNAASSKKEN